MTQTKHLGTMSYATPEICSNRFGDAEDTLGVREVFLRADRCSREQLYFKTVYTLVGGCAEITTRSR